MWPFKQRPSSTAPQPPKAAMTTVKAWAIDSGADERHSIFLGVFWFYPGLVLKPYQDGMRTAAFRTRRQAREAMEETGAKKTFPKARVVRVTVTISG